MPGKHRYTCSSVLRLYKINNVYSSFSLYESLLSSVCVREGGMVGVFPIYKESLFFF